MTDITPFIFPGTGNPEVRVIWLDDEPWFVALDVCNVLGYVEAHRAISRLDPDDRRQATVIDSLGRDQETNIINESGIYELVMRSDKPEARAFRRWVTSDLLPNLRKYGRYGKPKTREQIIAEGHAAVEEVLAEREIEIAEARRSLVVIGRQLAIAAPLAEAATALMVSDGVSTIREAAQLLNTGRTRMMNFLLDHDIASPDVQTDGYMPYQPHIDAGRFTHRLELVPNGRGGMKNYRTMFVTPKGLDWLRKKMNTHTSACCSWTRELKRAGR